VPWQVLQMLEQFRHSQVGHISHLKMVCEPFDLLLEEGFLMLVPISYAPDHHNVLCAGLQPQRYPQSLGRGHIAFHPGKVSTQFAGTRHISDRQAENYWNAGEGFWCTSCMNLSGDVPTVIITSGWRLRYLRR